MTVRHESAQVSLNCSSKYTRSSAWRRSRCIWNPSATGRSSCLSPSVRTPVCRLASVMSARSDSVVAPKICRICSSDPWSTISLPKRAISGLRSHKKCLRGDVAQREQSLIVGQQGRLQSQRRCSHNGIRKLQTESFPKTHGMVLDGLGQVGDRNGCQEISNALFL